MLISFGINFLGMFVAYLRKDLKVKKKIKKWIKHIRIKICQTCLPVCVVCDSPCQ